MPLRAATVVTIIKGTLNSLVWASNQVAMFTLSPRAETMGDEVCPIEPTIASPV